MNRNSYPTPPRETESGERRREGNCENSEHSARVASADCRERIKGLTKEAPPSLVVYYTLALRAPATVTVIKTE